jgi:hypothetical protein
MLIGGASALPTPEAGAKRPPSPHEGKEGGIDRCRARAPYAVAPASATPNGPCSAWSGRRGGGRGMVGAIIPGTPLGHGGPEDGYD